MEKICEYLAKFLAVVIILTMHEFAHAYAAYKCGDPTAKWSGRLTLNPTKHFDPIGLVCFALIGFGWAKPVPVNYGNFKRPRLDAFITSAAGVFVNYLSAFLFFPLIYSVAKLASAATALTYGHWFLFYFANYLFLYSLSFCVFNLLPLYPLDGFRIVDALNKRHGKVYRFLRDYGYRILLGLILLDFVCDLFAPYIPAISYLNVLGYFMSFSSEILGWPIYKLWNLILK